MGQGDQLQEDAVCVVLYDDAKATNSSSSKSKKTIISKNHNFTVTVIEED